MDKSGSRQRKRAGSFRQSSIFRKFLLIFTLTILLSSVLSGFIMDRLTENSFVESKVTDMRTAVESLQDLWIQYYVSYQSSVDDKNEWISNEAKEKTKAYQEKLFSRMELYEETLGAYSFIAERDGMVSMSYPLFPTDSRETEGLLSLPKTVVDRFIFLDGHYYFSEEQLDSLNEDDRFYDSGDFYGLYAKESAFYATVPKRIIYIHPDTKLTVDGNCIFMSVAMPEVTKARGSIIQYFTIATVITVLIDVIVLIMITRRITNPIRALQEAAGKMAAGDFQGKIQRTTHDEIGDLVDSFNRMTESLANLDAMRNDFIANVSHELRTPMTSIGGFIDAIIDGVVPPEKQEHYLRTVRSEITRLSDLVNELLDVARLQSGKVTLNRLKYDLCELVRENIIKLEPLIQKKKIDVRTVFEHDPEYVFIDKPSIDRVFINLIQNAVKFTPEGGRITIRTVLRKDCAEVTVADTGVGIPPEDLDMIFERFYKSDKSRGLDKKGTGLGLSIAKNILLAHQQTIRAESELGKGSKFIFTLPIDGGRKEDR